MPPTSSPVHSERMARFVDAGLYWVSSQALSRGRSTLDIMDAVLRGGGRLIQLREKDLPLAELVPLARQARELTQNYDALLIINDRVDVALAVGADGVHLGLDDFPVREARAIAPDLIIGASAHTVEEAHLAQDAGASYFNIGPLYPTETKQWDDAFLGLEGLRDISAVARVPFTVMGGIKPGHIPELVAAGARTLAVVTAISAADDPEQATRDFLADMRGAPVGM